MLHASLSEISKSPSDSRARPLSHPGAVVLSSAPIEASWQGNRIAQRSGRHCLCRYPTRHDPDREAAADPVLRRVRGRDPEAGRLPAGQLGSGVTQSSTVRPMMVPRVLLLLASFCLSSLAASVTHRWTNLNAYTDEVAEARICAGFHYRFSTIARRQMGRDIGMYAANTILLPIPATR